MLPTTCNLHIVDVATEEKQRSRELFAKLWIAQYNIAVLYKKREDIFGGVYV